jgi:hypothetical protein
MDHKNDSEKYPNDIFKEDASPRSSYDEDLTLTQSKFEKVLSATTEKYDIEKGHHHMAHIEPIKSSKLLILFFFFRYK